MNNNPISRNNSILKKIPSSSSINSTLSLLKEKKYNFINESPIFSRIEKTNFNKNLKLPICISILANNLSINENNINLNLNANQKFNTKFPHINKKEPISRNSNYNLFSTSGKKNSKAKEIFFNSFNMSNIGYKNNVNPIKNKINFSPLRDSSKLSTNKKNISLDSSVITNQKTPVNKQNKQKYKLSFSFMSESPKKEKKFSSNQYLKKINKPFNIYNLYSNHNNNKKIDKEFNKLFNENNSINIEKSFNNCKNNESIDNNNNSSNNKIDDNKINKNNNSNNKINKNNNSNNKINNNIDNNINSNNIDNNINSNNINDKIEKDKDNINNNNISIITHSAKIIIELKKLDKKGDNNANKEIIKIKEKEKPNSRFNKIIRLSKRLSESYINFLKIKNNNKFHLINAKENTETNIAFKKNKFLNKLKKNFSNQINNILNIQKKEMIINYKNKMEKIFNKENNKIKIREYLKKNSFSLKDYQKSEINNICNNSSKSSNYIETNTLNNNNYFNNCNLCCILKNYISFCKFGDLSVIFNKNINYSNKHSGNGNNYILNIHNSTYIQDFILKSLPFYKNNLIKKNHENKNNLINKHHSRNIKIKYRTDNYRTDNYRNSLNKNKFLRLSKQINSIVIKDIYKNHANKELLNNIKNQNLLKLNDMKFKDYSILNKRAFFIKEKELIKIRNKGNIIENSESSDNTSNNDKSYNKLFKYIIEGKSKKFINYYQKKKDFININQELSDGNNLLILSTIQENYHITKFLCEQGIEINNHNLRGNTALHYACAKQNYKIFDILIYYGAREDIINNKGLTASECIGQNI